MPTAINRYDVQVILPDGLRVWRRSERSAHLTPLQVAQSLEKFAAEIRASLAAFTHAEGITAPEDPPA